MTMSRSLPTQLASCDTLPPHSLPLPPAQTAPTTASSRSTVDLEVVVPAFNEAERLPATLERLTAYLLDCPWISRVVVVDNGSSDHTATAVHSIETSEIDVVTIGCSRPGKGAAVSRGLLSSTSPFVGFMDADLSTPVDTVWRAMQALRQGAAAAIASRYAPGARLDRTQPLGRRLGGTVFRALARPLVTDVNDTQCGFKFFQRDIVQAALRRCRFDGFAFDVELLQQIRVVGGRIVELPVIWTDDNRSSFRPVRDGIASFAAMASLYLGGGGR